MTTPVDPFHGVWQKLERAKYHAHKFRDDALAYWNSHPYEIVAKQEGPDFVWRVVSIRQPLPVALTMTAGDAFHNLRSAFDHFAYIAVPQPHNHNVAFPVWRKGAPSSTAAWKGSVKGMLNGASPRLIRAVGTLQCYQGGTEDWVRSVDDFDIIDKHHLLLTVASASTGIVLDASETFRKMSPDREFPPMELMIKSAGWDPVEPGLVVFTVTNSVGPGDNANTKFTFDITLGEPGYEGRPVHDFLTELIEKSEKLIRGLVAEV